MDASPDATPAERRARGVAAYARIFDVPDDQVPAAMASRVGPVFAEEAFQFAGGAAWADPALSGRDRSLAIVTALVAQGVSGDRLGAHLDLARKNGLDDDALTALMVLLAGYLGYAHASLALAIHAAPRLTGASTQESAPDLGR
jgi:4-carboxymuconolactone decarboxylase